jgi:hypothetical protein
VKLSSGADFCDLVVATEAEAQTHGGDMVNRSASTIACSSPGYSCMSVATLCAVRIFTGGGQEWVVRWP